MNEHPHEAARRDIEFCVPRHYNATVAFIDRHLETERRAHPAVIDESGSYSYADLAERVNRAGNALLGLGLTPESRVLMCMHDTVDFPAVFWGAIKAGLIPVPVNTLLTTADYRYMIDDARVRAVVVSAALWDRFEPVLSGHPELAAVVAGAPPQAAADEGPRSLASLCERACADLRAAATTADDVAFWLYTSGSTGNPKGALHLHRHLAYTAESYGARVLEIQPQDVVFSAAKLFFAYGLGNAMTFPFHVGATAVLMSGRPTPESVMAVMRTHQPSIFFGVPTLYSAILADASLGPAAGSGRLRRCISAGEALPEGVARPWAERFGVEIIDGIGTTEMLHIFLSNRAGSVRHGSTGRAVPGYRVKLVDEADAPVAVDQVGELLVSGGSAAVAYWNQRDRSLATFQGRWTRTGDKYTVDADGYYHYCGRTDDMLKVGGIWVSPFEVESVLFDHEAVLEAAVVGQEDEAGLVKPKAFVVLRDPGAAGDPLRDALQQHVKARLAPYKYPRWIEFVAELPKTATGKIQRFKLR